MPFEERNQAIERLENQSDPNKTLALIPGATKPVLPQPHYIGEEITNALAQEGLTDLSEANAKAEFAREHPVLNAAGDLVSIGLPSLVSSG